MKIITWNINSINARFGILSKLLSTHKPDILMLQEIKSQDVNFPSFEIQSLGYKAVFRGQKSYNGVALLVKDSLLKNNDLDALIDIPNFPDDNARFIQTEINDTVFIGVYAPNGNPAPGPKFDYKLEWYEALNKHLKNLLKKDKKIVLGGDFNIVPTRQDVHDFDKYADNGLCRPEVRKHYNRLINIGFVDVFRVLHPEPDLYTFWDYRRNMFALNQGFRIDFFLLSGNISGKLKKCYVDDSFRKMEKPSDHVPLILEI